MLWGGEQRIPKEGKKRILDGGEEDPEGGEE